MEISKHKAVERILRARPNRVTTLNYIMAQTKLTKKQIQRAINYLCQNRSVTDKAVIEIIKSGNEWRWVPIGNDNATGPQRDDDDVESVSSSKRDEDTVNRDSGQVTLYEVIAETDDGVSVMTGTDGVTKFFKELKIRD